MNEDKNTHHNNNNIGNLELRIIKHMLNSSVTKNIKLNIQLKRKIANWLFKNFDSRDSETKKHDEYCLKIDKLQKKINVLTKNIQM